MTEAPLTRGTAVAVALDAYAPLAGTLFLGDSGAGKSDLALRLIEDCPFRRTRLIADDYVAIAENQGQWIANAPEQTKGLLEVRGLGLARHETVADMPLSAVFDLAAAPARMPNVRMWRNALPLLALRPFEASAPAKVRAALRAILGGHFFADGDDKTG